MASGKSSTRSSISGSVKNELTIEDPSAERQNGLSMYLASFFLMAQMAGAGFLALPQALSNTGWTGIAMLPFFAVTVAFSGTRLGHCWVILEERWDQYKKPSRQPYLEIGYRAFGRIGRGIIMASVLITLIGSTIVFIILISQFLNALITKVSLCEFAVIMVVVLTPFTWLGTPSDFWQASVLAVFSTLVACSVIFVQLLVDMDEFPDPTYSTPTLQSFSLGFGTILFAFGGASVFPTIQNDMKDRSQFWKSVVIAFCVILTMYMPVALTGYILLGEKVPGNILLYSDDLPISVKIAVGFEIINLAGTFLIAFNPVSQILEELLNIPRTFGWKRVVSRSSVMAFELLVALALPDFGLILNLVGGSTVTICSFLFPPLMYMKLASDRSNDSWPIRIIPKWEKLLLWFIVIVALVGGIAATASAITGIINTSFSDSCFSNFT